MSNSIICPILIEGKAECGEVAKRKGLPSRLNKPDVAYHCECKGGHKFHQKITPGEFEPCDCVE